MSIDADEEAGNLVRLTVREQLTTADQAALVYFVTKAIQRHGQVRLLILIEDFAGWRADEEWGDEALRLEDDRAVIKAAFVGAPRWRDGMLAFVAKPFRTIPIEYYESESAARAWLDT